MRGGIARAQSARPRFEPGDDPFGIETRIDTNDIDAVRAALRQQ